MISIKNDNKLVEWKIGRNLTQKEKQNFLVKKIAETLQSAPENL